MNQKYELKPLTSSSDNAYVEAMKVYLRVMPADVKTDTNEIAYSLEHPVAANGRKMFFFALRYQSATIGFAQFAFLPNQKVLFMDYLAISEDYKKNSIFYPFFSMIMIYFNDIGLNYDYFITEIGAQNHDEAVDIDSAFLRKVLAMEDFKIIDAKYKQPCLGIQKQESNIDAHLYLKTSAPLYMITQEFYSTLLREIYYEHYDQWYQDFLTDAEYSQYHNHIDNQYTDILESLQSGQTIKLVDCISCECAYFNASCPAPHMTTAGYAPQSKRKFPKWPISVLMIFTTFLLSILFYKLILYLNISLTSFSAIYAATTTLAIGVTAYYFKSKD